MEALGDKKYVEDNLHEAIESAEGAVHLFSSKMQHKQERYVCEVFLRCLGIVFEDKDIIHLDEKDQPPDIKFKNAHFEIMEVMDEDRRRHDEYKRRLIKLKTNPTIDDFSRPYGPQENEDVTFSELIPLITSRLKEIKIDKRGCAPEVRATLDVLVYVNLEDRFLDIKSHIPDCPELRSQGWRSVSMQFGGSYGHVFYANENAPGFILRRAETILL